MPSPTQISGDKTPGQIFHLPVRFRALSMAEAAVHLGLPERRMKLLALLGTGPARTQSPDGKIVYRREDLELYLTALHEKADISGTEMIRRRTQAAANRQRALELVQIGSKTGFPDPDPFMMLATGADARQHACFFVIKVMALFGLIMLCISSTPLLRAHFN
ncbi:hypothetical protein [Gluconobacter sphaericus]|uniref:Helix-turn-helix domain-containing protein n=1 Tax=Gluconobacter sphaericus NBRC 12467 TaxID=1307951 RepID=A0AA37SER7_9PROT|nr:hypothetical protein [Gluconobacter sphaericus]MBF0885819.1 hypothetical protein [Gluconobacter sphaericus]MBS1086513.1 hypothetical protein [Gluconobacter sphaericus]MBS1096979.1 hypothetical protein [Gluconobacter sphaericus]MBS1100553.1 hypothetical protein [Gluconobacter sphaericus]QQX91577.1 hypothetical protein IGS75_02840 [Gluconobacter sphaericus]